MKSLEIRNKIFEGIECEGNEIGIRTLFIPCGAIQEEFFYVIGKQRNITRFYFGAGNKRGMSQVVIKQFESLPKKQIIPKNFILEIDNIQSLNPIPQWLLSRMQIVFIFPKKENERLRFITSIKFLSQNNKLYWFNLKKPIITSLNDIAYKKDSVV